MSDRYSVATQGTQTLLYDNEVGKVVTSFPRRTEAQAHADELNTLVKVRAAARAVIDADHTVAEMLRKGSLAEQATSRFEFARAIGALEKALGQ